MYKKAYFVTLLDFADFDICRVIGSRDYNLMSHGFNMVMQCINILKKGGGGGGIGKKIGGGRNQWQNNRQLDPEHLPDMLSDPFPDPLILFPDPASCHEDGNWWVREQFNWTS